MSKGYSRIPSTDHTHVTAGGVTIADIHIGHEYGEREYGRMYILIKSVGAHAVTDLTFRYAFDDLTFEQFALISDAQADEMASKLIATTGTVSLCVPIPRGTLRIAADTAGLDCQVEVYYTRFDADMNDVIVDGYRLARDRQITEVVNDHVDADIGGVETFTIDADTDVVLLQNVGVNDVMINFGVNTSLGTCGVWLKRCDEDLLGNPVLGTGGFIEIDKFKGDVFFYSVAGAIVNVVVMK
jgi:hypothetical protein